MIWIRRKIHVGGSYPKISNPIYWNLDLLPFVPPKELAEKILAIPISRHCPHPDSIAWCDSPDGSFSSTSAYNLIHQEQINQPDCDLSWVWKLDCLPKIKAFLWLLCLNKLPTRSLLHHQHLIPDNLCNSCFSEETCRHFIWECPRSSLFWGELGLTPTPLHLSTSLICWIKTNARITCLVNSIPSGILFVFGCWKLWQARNSRIFEPGRPSHPPSECLMLASEFFHLGRKGIFGKEKVPITITWLPPPIGYFKLNTDGAVKHELNLAGCGGLIRDHGGNWIVGFAKRLHQTTSFMAELWAIREGIQLAMNHNCLPIMIESDALLAIDKITSNEMVDNSYNALINDCRWLLTRTNNLGINHVFREGNQAADALANLGCSLNSDFCTFDRPPPGVAPFVYRNIGGVGSTRLCNVV